MKRREFIGVLGSMTAWPLGARAQTPRAKRIAMVHPSNSVQDLTAAGRYKAFFDELNRLGYVEGRNLLIERYSGEGQPEQYAALARRVVDSRPDLIFAIAGPLALRFKAATATIPIVTVTADPIAIGLVASIARPGGNVTGISVDGGLEILGKRIELLVEATSHPSRAGYLASRANWQGTVGAAAREVAQAAGIALTGQLLAGFNDAEYQRVLGSSKQDGIDALIVSEEAEHITYRRLLVELAAKGRIPAVYPYREFTDAGGLMAYSLNTSAVYRRAATVVDKIFNGAGPGDIPFYQETRFDVIVNLKAAKAMALTIPPTLLARADEVIE